MNSEKKSQGDSCKRKDENKKIGANEMALICYCMPVAFEYTPSLKKMKSNIVISSFALLKRSQKNPGKCCAEKSDDAIFSCTLIMMYYFNVYDDH